MLFRHTLGIDATTIDAAGQHARAQNAFIGIGAFGVAATAYVIVANRLTASLSVGDGVRRASAHNRPNRRRIEHSASLLHIANVRSAAWILTATIHARQLWRTIRVGRAFGLHITLAATFNVRIAKRSRLTIADGLMVSSFAMRLWRT